MGSDMLDELLVLALPLVLEAASVFLLGLIAIPLLRSRKTGRFEWHIGKRFKADGSEPSMGGAVMVLAFAMWFFPIAMIADVKNSKNLQDSREGLIFAGIYVIIIVCAGLAEDWLKDYKARPAGLPPVLKQLVIFSASLLWIMALDLKGSKSTEVLLPFNMGFMEFGVLYYPLIALAVTMTIDLFKLYYCFGGREKEQVGGLNEASGAFSLIAVGISCEICDLWAGSVMANFAAAACIGMLIWTLSPSKLISGVSGAYFAGAAFSAAVILSKLELLLVIAALPQLANFFAAALHYIRYKHKRPEGADPKRPLSQLWRQRGHSDYMIITLFSVMSIIGAAASMVFALYAQGFIWLV